MSRRTKVKEEENKEQQELDAYNLNVIKLRFKDIEEELSHLKHWLKRVDVLEGQMANLVEEIVKLKGSPVVTQKEIIATPEFIPFTVHFDAFVGKDMIIISTTDVHGVEEREFNLPVIEALNKISTRANVRDAFWQDYTIHGRGRIVVRLRDMRDKQGLRILHLNKSGDWDFVLTDKAGAVI